MVLHTRVGSVQDYKRGQWPADAVYVGMPGKAARAWGIEDAQVGPFGKPWACLDDPRGWLVAYREYLWNRLHSDPEFVQQVYNLHGKLLLCWCTAKARRRGVEVVCHAHTLAKAVEWLVHEVGPAPEGDSDD